MATFLVIAVDRENPPDGKVRPLLWKRGMIVDVYDDDRQPPLQIPQPAPFVTVKITGITKAQAEKYLKLHEDTDGTPLARRLYHISWADLPNPVKNALQNNRHYETTWTAIKQYVKNRVTGVSE